MRKGECGSGVCGRVLDGEEVGVGDIVAPGCCMTLLGIRRCARCLTCTKELSGLL